MSRRQQRIDLGLADPHSAISSRSELLSLLERTYTGAAGYASYDCATGVYKEQTREEFGRSLMEDLTRDVGTPPPRLSTPSDSPPASPLGSPVPLQRCLPRGPDPYAEEREKVRAQAAAGEVCPVNQHGCMYFSASEWRFCKMCEWEVGRAQGIQAGTLSKMGVSRAVVQEESARGLDLALTREQAQEILVRTNCHFKDVSPQLWTGYGDRLSADGTHYFTRSELWELLKIYSVPAAALTDELWTELKERYDAPDEAEAAAAPPCPLLVALGLVERAPFQEPLPSPPARLELPQIERPPVQSLKEIMAQQKAGIGPEAPAAAPAEPEPPKPRVQVWKSVKQIQEEEREARVAAEMEKMADERRAAYHKRRQEELERAGAPKCYKCGWFGHIARACKNVEPEPAPAPAPYRRGLSNNAYRRIEREYAEDLALERAAAARREAERGKPAPRGRTLADFL